MNSKAAFNFEEPLSIRVMKFASLRAGRSRTWIILGFATSVHPNGSIILTKHFKEPTIGREEFEPE